MVAEIFLTLFAGFAFGGLSFTHQKKDVDLGPLQVSHKEKDTMPLLPQGGLAPA